MIELGANDALRGLPLAMTKANLLEMTRAVKAAGAKAVLVGMQVPPNYGQAYGDEFARLFAEVAQGERVARVPFLLAGVADAPRTRPACSRPTASIRRRRRIRACSTTSGACSRRCCAEARRGLRAASG